MSRHQDPMLSMTMEPLASAPAPAPAPAARKAALAARVEEFYNKCNSKEDGKFCEGEDGPGRLRDNVKKAGHDSKTGAPGVGSKKHPIKTGDIEVAAKALAEGKHVELDQPDQVSTLLDKLSAIVADAKAKGADAPMYNLCGVTIKGTNLFCTESKGVPRVKMPQLASKKPLPGSKADGLPRNQNGEVDISVQFAEHMRSKGVSVTEQDVKASHLRATQNELNGGKVAGIAVDHAAGKLPPGSIFVSRDNYVVDGHHRWAAVVGNDLRDNVEGDLDISVKRIDMPILDVLREANAFSLEWGIPQAKA